MLGLLDGAVISITVEKIGEGDEGFEFLVERPDTAEWHQCKRQTLETSWTITALAREAIIENFSAKLQLSPSHRCVFVSTDIAKQVKLLQEKRPYALTLAEFEKILSKEETAYWLQLHDKLSFGGDAALDWIDRCEFHTLSEDFLESVVASEVAFWFKGDPEKLIAAVRTWVEEDATLNRPITRADFLAFAQEKGFEVKQYEVDQAMPGRLSGATASYDASYALIGAGLFRIPRTETDRLVAALLDEPSSKTVALVGSAGSGKSVIIRDAIKRIATRNHLQLAFRVDQVGEPASLAQLGTAVIDVADSPAIVLERPHVLISQLEVKGFRSIASETLDFQSVNVLIGPNGAGKSNLIAFFRMMSFMLSSPEGLARYVGQVGGASSLLHNGPKVSEQIEARLVLETDSGTNEYEFALAYASGDALYFDRERCRFSAKGRPVNPRWIDFGAGHTKPKLLDAPQVAAKKNPEDDPVAPAGNAGLPIS